MHYVGIGVDQDYRGVVSAGLLELANRKGQEFQAYAPEVKISEESGEPNKADLRALIYEECKKPGQRNFGIPCPPVGSKEAKTVRSDGGLPGVGKEARLYIYSRAPQELKQILDAYRDAIEPLKLRSSFVESQLIESEIWDDGRRHPDWNSASSQYSAEAKDSDGGGAVTGRLTGNLQNVPKANKKRGWPNLRGIYTPKPGCVFVEADYSAAELHVISLVAHDDKLLAMLRAGDVHTLTAIEWFKLDANTTKETCPERIRRIAKEVRFASNYRAAPPKVWTRVAQALPDITLEEVSLLHRKFLSSHPALVTWWDEEYKRVLRRGYSESCLLNRQRVYPFKPETTETANFPIQSTVADIINLSCVAKGLLVKWRVVAQVHDSLLIECPEDKAGECSEEVAQIMQGPWHCDTWLVPDYTFPVDVKIVRRWGE